MTTWQFSLPTHATLWYESQGSQSEEHCDNMAVLSANSCNSVVCKVRDLKSEEHCDNMAVLSANSCNSVV